MDETISLRIPLFRKLPKVDLFKLVNDLPKQEFKQGSFLFHETERGDSLFIIMDGKVEIVLGPNTPDEMLLRTCSAGECVGEMSLIMPQGLRTASARVKEDSTVKIMTREKFNQLLQNYPQIAYSMVEIMSERLDTSNESAYNDLAARNQKLQIAYNELKEAQAQIIEKERLERELQVAADIQISILPDVLPDTEEFSFGAKILPARQVGGDFYDVFELQGERIGVVIGDVADKGIPSALFMARAHALIMAEADIAITAAEVMQLVNSHITRLQKSTQFVTVLYGILDLKTRLFSYARAGHEPPLILHADGSVERMPFSSGMALGLWDPITLDEKEILLKSGDSLILFTDGMTDCRNPEGESFGLDRIKNLLSGLPKLNAQQICDTLLETLLTYQNGSKQDDDVTLVAIKAK